MRTNYTDVFRDREAVEKYEREVYAPRSFSSHVSDRQRQWLRGFATNAFAEPPVHHDFACGTGRGLRMLEGLTAGAHGYDTSEPMLAKARELGVPAELHQIAESGPLPTAADVGQRDGQVALVTMFRLMLNAPQHVRERAMEFASGMLPTAESGLLLVENHGNAGSMRHLRKAVRRADDRRWFAELSHAEVADMFDRYGFELVTRQGFTLLTQGFYTVPPVSWLAPALDDVASRRGFLSGCATNVVYVARRKGLDARIPAGATMTRPVRPRRR